jgi:hypothetical protein
MTLNLKTLDGYSSIQVPLITALDHNQLPLDAIHEPRKALSSRQST